MSPPLPPAYPSNPLYDIAASIFGALDAAFVARGVEIGGEAGERYAPNRRYIHVGTLPFDFDEQLVVAIQSITPTSPLEPTTLDLTVPIPLYANYLIWILREVPTLDDAGNLPLPTQISALSETLAADAWLLLTTLTDLATRGTLINQCADVTIGILTAVGPEGNILGWQLPVTVSLT